MRQTDTPEPTPADPLCIEELKTLSDTIRAENTLISQRMFWGLTLQGFLFTSYFLSDKNTMHDIEAALPVIGILVGLSSLLGTYLAHVAMKEAMDAFADLRERMGRDGPVRPGRQFPRVVTILAPHFFIPMVVIGGWIYIFAMLHGADVGPHIRALTG